MVDPWDFLPAASKAHLIIIFTDYLYDLFFTAEILYLLRPMNLITHSFLVSQSVMYLDYLNQSCKYMLFQSLSMYSLPLSIDGVILQFSRCWLSSSRSIFAL